MHQVSIQLEETRKSECKTEEYIQDMLEERKKLINRCQKLTMMQADYAAIMVSAVYINYSTEKIL